MNIDKSNDLWAILTLLSPILFPHLHSSLENQQLLIVMKIQSFISIGESRMGLNLPQTPFPKKCHYLTYSVIFWNIPLEISLIDIRDNSVRIAFFWWGDLLKISLANCLTLRLLNGMDNSWRNDKIKILKVKGEKFDIQGSLWEAPMFSQKSR